MSSLLSKAKMKAAYLVTSLARLKFILCDYISWWTFAVAPTLSRGWFLVVNPVSVIKQQPVYILYEDAPDRNVYKASVYFVSSIFSLRLDIFIKCLLWVWQKMTRLWLILYRSHNLKDRPKTLHMKELHFSLCISCFFPCSIIETYCLNIWGLKTIMWIFWFVYKYLYLLKIKLTLLFH